MRTLIGIVLSIVSVVGFASTFIFGAALTRSCHVAPEALSFLRFAIAGGVMLLMGLATPRGRARLAAPTRRDWLAFAWLGPIGTSVMAWCVFMGCARVSAANASMADALTPIMIFIVAAVRARYANPKSLVGLACGFLGALMVIQVIHPHGLALEAYSVGDVFILLSAATWGVYTVYGRPQIERLGATVFTTWTMLVGAAAIGVALPFLDIAWPATAHAWLLVAGLGLISTLMPFWAWNEAQKYLPVSVLGIFAYSTPAVAVGLAIVFLGETATWMQWVGTALVVASAVIETGMRKK